MSSPTAPSVPSGFGTVIEFEHTLQSSTKESLQAAGGSKTDGIGRTLQNQSNRLADVISLLEHRCALLPHPARFQALAMRHQPSPGKPPTSPVTASVDLADLVEQHRDLLDRIERMVGARAVSGGKETVLAEVARNHAQMVWRLTTLLKEEETARGRTTKPDQVNPVPITTEGDWENEGGTFRPVPPATDE